MDTPLLLATRYGQGGKGGIFPAQDTQQYTNYDKLEYYATVNMNYVYQEEENLYCDTVNLWQSLNCI